MSIVYAGLALVEICVLFASAIGVLVLAGRWIARWIIGDFSAETFEMKQKWAPPKASSRLQPALRTARSSAHRLG